MNLVSFCGRWIFFVYLIGCMTLAVGTGCQAKKVSSTEEIIEFKKAGPLRPQVDMERVVKSHPPIDSYRVVAGDVLELFMPAILQASELTAVENSEKTQSYLCRVSKEGSINLPIVGAQPVAGKDLSQIESEIVQLYYPKYLIFPPSVVIQVKEYQTQMVSIVGAVEDPGLYPLRSDEMSLVTLLMKAGGVIEEGAKVIRIRHAGDTEEAEPVVLPVKQLDIPFIDVSLAAGDMLEVEQLDPQLFTVIGLVNKPGAYPIAPGAQYNLMQALAIAGGVNEIADPEYVRVYRQTGDGEIVDATFHTKGTGLTDAARIQVNPGDVISAEHNARTDFRMLMSQMFRVYFNMGTNWDPWD